LLTNNTLIRFDSASPGTIQSSVAITGLQTGTERVLGIDFRPRTGQLLATTSPTGVAASATLRTYSVNPLTGAATLIGAIPGTVPGAADVRTGYDFNPTVDRIRFVNENNENGRINPNNGTLAGNDTDLTFVPPATGPIVAEAYDRNFDRPNAVGLPTTLYAIDRGSSRLVVQGGINGAGPGGPNGGVISSIGPLGITLTAGSDGGFDVTPSTQNAGLGTALAALTAGGVTGLYNINLATGAATLVGNIGNGASQLADLSIVPDHVVAIGSASGRKSTARLLDAVTGQVRISVQPFGSFQGGVRVAVGDVVRATGSDLGIPDLIVAKNAPGGHIKVFSGVTGQQAAGPLGNFSAFPGFGGTVNVSSGDVNGDGTADVIVVTNGNGGRVKEFSGVDGALLGDFRAYPGFRGEVQVTAADFNNDGRDEIVTVKAGKGFVRVFNADGTAFTSPGFVSSFVAFNTAVGAVSVAAGDVNGDGRAEIVVGSGAGTRGKIRVFSGANGSLLTAFPAFAVGVTCGANVALADVNGDNRFDLRITPGAGKSSKIFNFDLLGNRLGTTAAFGAFLGGTFIAGARY
jgi:hypothetical protein